MGDVQEHDGSGMRAGDDLAHAVPRAARMRPGVFSARTARRVAGSCVVACVLAVLLEVGTLVGAPLSSPYNPDDWHLGRMAVFFVMMLPVGAFALFFDWHARAARLRAWWRESGPQAVRRAAIVVAVLIGLGVLTVLVAGVACQLAQVSYAWPYQLFFAAVVEVVACGVILRKSLAAHPERLLLIIVLAAGAVMAVISPLYTHVSWDDQIHYDRTVAASYLVDPEYTPADVALVDRHYNDVAQYSRKAGRPVASLPYEEVRLGSIVEELDRLADNTASSVRVEGSQTLGGSRIIHYSLVAYVPSAMALWVARLLDLPFTVAFLMGRLANVLAYALAVYFACRRLRSGKLILAMCALVPTSMFLAANYSYDFWLTCFLMLGFSYFIGELQRPDEPLAGKNLAVMVGAFLVGLGPKAVYVPVAAMLLFMPRSKFARKERCARSEAQKAAPRIKHGVYLAIIFASGAAVLASFVLPMFIGGPGSGDPRGGEVNPGEQISFILSEPASYASIFAQFLLWYVHPSQALYALVDFCGIESAYNMSPFIMALLPVVALLDRARCDMPLATHAKRLCMLLLTLLTILLMATALYISFTPPRWDIIAGMQGRYLIPLLFPFLALCLPFKPLIGLTDRLDRRVLNAVVLALAACAIFGAVFEAMVLRF